tara:strand:+ start:55 stop:639 length:585 start_codon:yes stop_codon:yes gene_type:complete
MNLSFKNLKEFFRDKSRDNLYKNLKGIGVDCSLAERGINEEKLFNPWNRRSLGIININSDDPIKYINIIKQDGGKNRPPRWWYFFAIPENKVISKDNSIEVKSIRKKSTPLIGKVESVKWEPNSNSNNLARIFTEDNDINYLSISLGDIKVQSLHDNFSGFSIELEFKVKEKKLNQISWTTLNKIAKYCLKNNL